MIINRFIPNNINSKRKFLYNHLGEIMIIIDIIYSIYISIKINRILTIYLRI